MRKLILDKERVERVYKETGSAIAASKALGVSKIVLSRFMDENGIERKKLYTLDDSISKSQLENDYKELNNLRKIAAKYGVSKTTIKRLFSKYGIAVNVKQSPDRFVNEIKRLAKEGLDSFEIADRLQISTYHLNSIAKRNGIELKRRYHKGFITTHNGYRKVLDKESEDADSKGYVHEHRKVLARALGIDSIPKECVVHHKNGDKTDNSVDNLEMMSRSDHARLHRHC